MLQPVSFYCRTPLKRFVCKFRCLARYKISLFMWYLIPRSVENNLQYIHIIYLIPNIWIINALSE